MRHVHLVAVAEGVLEMHVRSEATQLAICHDADAAAERIRLVHGVGREDNDSPRLGPLDKRPHETLGLRVQARGGLVEEDHRGVAHEGDAERHAALLPPGERRNARAHLEAQPHGLGRRLRRGALVPRGHALEAAVEEHVLENRERGPEDVELRAHAHLAVDEVHLREDVVARHGRAARGGSEEPGEHRDGGGLARAVGPQEAEALAFVDLQREVVDGHLRAAVHFAEAEDLHGRSRVVVTLLHSRTLLEHVRVLIGWNVVSV
mmetsp:Transcript_18894/g.55446  ORF Transcript_18894/g.55446 Transcript_18894/m.55446 type:complete len:263 (+) Transcript_18894:1213-2001(+)